MNGSTRFGANVREWRQRRKLSQEKLGEKIGSDGPRISRMESGAENPTLETIDKIAAALEVDASYLHRPRPEEESAEHEESRLHRRIEENERLSVLDQLYDGIIERYPAADDTWRGDVLRAQAAVADAAVALARALRRADEDPGSPSADARKTGS